VHRGGKAGWLQQTREVGPGVQSVYVWSGGQHRHRIIVGDRVSVDRDGWRDKVGIYVGKDYKSGRLKIQFEQHGGALLFCFSGEVTANARAESE
jgi:hypothetical protein